MSELITTEDSEYVQTYRTQSWMCHGNYSEQRLANGGGCDWYTREVSRSKDSRPLPSGPKWLHPTSIPELSRLRWTAGLESRTYPGPNVVCWPGPHVPTMFEEEAYFNFMSSWTPVPDVNPEWAFELRKKIKARTVNLSSALVEMRETCDMFGDLARGIWKVYRRIRKGRLPKGVFMNRKERLRFHTGDVSAAWLQANFGIAPLISDVYSTWLALQLAASRDNWRRCAIKDVVAEGYEQYEPAPGFTGNKKTTVKNRCVTYIRLNVDKPYDIGNPAEWIWESIPFSFVIDWSFDIGKRLSVLDAMKPVTHLTGSLSTWSNTNIRIQGANEGAVPKRDNVLTQSSYSRQVLGIDDIPQASLIPEYKQSDSVKKVFHGLALLDQIKRADGRIPRRYR